MKFSVASRYPANVQTVFFGVGSGKNLAADIKAIEGYVDGKLASELTRRKFKGNVGEGVTLPAPAKFKAPYVTLVGIGKEADSDRTRRASAIVVAHARANKFTDIAMMIPGTPGAGEACQLIAEGLALADYRFDRHKSAKSEREITVTVVTDTRQAAAVRRALAQAKIITDAATLARDLANEPPSLLTPREFARRARAVAAKSGLGYKVFGPAEIKRLGMNAFRAVSLGSDEPPQLIRLQYRPAKAKRHVVLVGKSITYDSGGLNLKPSRGGSLESMKLDMGGGAAVIGAMSALKALKVPVKVTGYLPATENMISGHAYKPGDILKTYNGKTIEVGNTDAEGRLALADTLALAADKDKPDEIIDLATLTDTEFSLGPDYAAIFSTDRKIEAKLKEAGEATGEKLWPLPFPNEYMEFTKSPVADFSNIVSNRMYTLSGALLLKNFVGKVPWTHLDIGGPATPDSDRGYVKKGGSGFGTRLLLEYLRR